MKDNNTIDVWSFHLPDHQREVEHFRALLAPQELDRLATFFRPQDGERFLLCRGLLRQILGQRLQTDPTTLVFKQNDQGKPFLSNEALEFNLSHSGDRLLIAVARDRAVGIDIEFRRNRVNLEAIAERWFTQEERSFLQTLDDPQHGFFSIWTKKEAFVKALGTGIFRGLNSFTVPFGEQTGSAVLATDNNWFFQSLVVDPEYAAALVSQAPIPTVHLHTR